MAKDEKSVEQEPVVYDAAETPEPVIRLKVPTLFGGEDPSPRPRRLGPPSQRLDLPSAGKFESRTHQPTVDALIEPATTTLPTLEQTWGKDPAHHHPVPWGWFVLIGMVIAGGVTWSLTRVKTADAQADKIRVATESAIESDVREEQEADQLVRRIESTVREFFEATSVDALARLARQPERVRPLMERYYAEHPLSPKQLLRSKTFQPLTLEGRANFWAVTAEFANHEKHNLILEILSSGEARIDWETLVCHQPLSWDRFAKERPAGTSLDFRVYLEPDHLFSHEFADSSHWNCFRLTAPDSEESLFGYAQANEGVSQELLELLSRKRSHGLRTSVILRLSIPEGLQSRRGVVIEKVLSPRWLYLDPPDSSS